MSANMVASSLAVGYGHRPIVSDIDFVLEPGALMVLIGTNGSGKSTLLKTLAGLLTPQSGSVHVLGEAPGVQPARVAYLPQHPVSSHTLPLRVRDIVAMGRFAHRGLLRRVTPQDASIVTDVMKRTGADAFSTRPLRDLSGGQQQRTHLAQVLAREAEVLLLDEPTAGLDISGREAVADLISQERSRGVTVVMATHELGDAESADIVMLLAQRVVAQGTPAQALSDAALRECFGFTQPH
ncbi:MAG: ABC transporter ATP-binding protein [Ilumatobacteraceae bacterium]|nr:ABC transporter ATP-binding protein [Ilumatobacteraceae bacterium]